MSVLNDHPKRPPVPSQLFQSPGPLRMLQRWAAHSVWLPFFIALAWGSSLVAAKDQGLVPSEGRAFRFGFSTALMPEVSENDARAAMKMWASTMLKTGAISADPDVLLSRDLATMTTALREGTVDGVAITTSEWFQLRDHIRFNRCVFSLVAGSITEEYLLLVHAQSSFNRIEDLQDRSLNILDNSRMSLALPWLDSVLQEKGLKPARNFFDNLREEPKVTKTVLPVFFRKIDACLVTRKSFEAMSDLNPEVGRQLRAIATSPLLIASGFFFREGYPRKQQDKYLSEFTNIHSNPAGQQILTVFQIERLQEYPVSVLDDTLLLLQSCQRLPTSSNSLGKYVPVPQPLSQKERMK